MFEWGDPTWLKWIWFVVIIGTVAIVYEGLARNRLKKYFGPKHGPFLISSLSESKRRWHLILQSLVLVCFVLALARPLLGSKQTEAKQTGVELIIAFDVSNSMLAEDNKPSRLEFAKKEIDNLLSQLGGDRVGLIAFAGSAALISPLTTDHSALRMYINSLSTDSISNQGTNFKAVIDQAISAFERGGVETTSGTKPTRVLLVASDGEDNEPGANDEIKKALEAGIHIYTLGFGSSEGAPIPLRDDRGQVRGFKKDKKDQVVMSVPSFDGLKKLADAGGGVFYPASYSADEIKAIVDAINHLQRAEFKSTISTEHDEKFQIPLLIGLILALVELLFGDRRLGARPWRGRFEVSG